MNRIQTAFVATLLVASSSIAQSTGSGTLRVEQPAGHGLINDVDQATVATHPATEYIEASTLAVMDVDLTKVNVEETLSWIFDLTGQPPENAEGMVPATSIFNGFIESLKGAGVRHMYVTGSTRSIFDGGPLVIVPCTNVPVVNGLATVFAQNAPKSMPMKVQVGEGVVIAGAQPAVERVVKQAGVQRGDLILPLNGEDQLDHSLVIALPRESRDELVAFWPDALPKRSPLQFSPRRIAADIDRVVISFRLPPDPQVRANIETVDASAAERVKEVIGKVLKMSPDAEQSIEVDVDIANVTVEASADVLAGLAQVLLAPARKKAMHMQNMNRLKQVGLAMHNYYAAEKHLPPRCLTDRDGKPLHSWRVTLLPYLEEGALYDEIQLETPWDSDDNAGVLQADVSTLSEDGQPNRTRIRVPVITGSLWHGEGPPREFRDVIDGTSNTIAAIHTPAEAATHWADPSPWVLSEEDPMSDVFGDRDLVSVLMLDGSARTFSKDEMTNEKLKAMLTFAGREMVE